VAAAGTDTARLRAVVVPSVRVAATVRGVVQGVGFRPHVARIAAAHGVTGWCGNDDESVFIEAQGTAAAVANFLREVREHAPVLAVIDEMTTADRDTIPGESDFRIVESRHADGVRTLIPPDVGCCDDCRRELRDPDDRRFGYPFITCTNCGPRLSIIRDLPYDRPLTTMSVFPMCAACRAEYEDPLDRRYHAQPISCFDCGPTLALTDAAGSPVSTGTEALAAARRALGDGRIVAVKGLGGYTLMCDARSDAAVRLLRERKRRPDKPFAVMAGSIEEASRIAHLDAAAAREMTGPARPIVIADAATDADLAPSVAPGLSRIGIMLPSAAVHEILLNPTDVVVATSGNVSGDPLCFREDDAFELLGAVADLFVTNDRGIHVPVEDSVLLAGGADGDLIPLRRSRGYAPLPIRLSASSGGGVVLAVGGELKNTFAIVRDDRAFLSPHVGDMGSLACQDAFERGVAQFEALHRSSPDLLVADLHPDYATTRWAQRHADRSGIPLVQVQHHHAHALSLVAEHGAVGTRVAVAAVDGTGWGEDSTIWGGEILLIGADPLEYERVAHVPRFRLVGGDTAARNPWRVAVGLLRDWGIDDSGIPVAADAPPAELALVHAQLASAEPVGVIATSSLGRVFDAVAAILGIRHRITYEAQAAMELEAAAGACEHGGHPDAAADLPAMVADIVERMRAGQPVACLARRFHDGVAAWIATALTDLVSSGRADVAGITGGVAQNRVLLNEVGSRLSRDGVPMMLHRRVPAGDGGLSLGQALAGHLMLAGSSGRGE